MFRNERYLSDELSYDKDGVAHKPHQQYFVGGNTKFYGAKSYGAIVVHGRSGEDPTEPSRSGPFPHPEVSHEPRIQQLADDFERTGHRPFHLPA